jgi:hypothetical protein
MMDVTLGGLAFFGLITAHLLAVVAVHNAPGKGETREPKDLPEEVRIRYLLTFGG